MSLIVQKYGGTSVADLSCIQRVAERVVKTASEGHQVIAVVSAMGHTTDELVSLAGGLNGAPSSRELDLLLSSGEQISSALLAIAVQALGRPALALTGALAGIATEPHHGDARITSIDPCRIRAGLDAGQIVVVAGFQGVAPDGSITTLGRGGSDTTAVALAAALDAERCEIFTDVDGVYTTDPNLNPNAQRLDEITYDQMLAFAALGAQVLHPRSVEAGRDARVTLCVRSTFSDAPGTRIVAPHAVGKQPAVLGVTFQDAHVSLIGTRLDLQEKVSAALASANIPIHAVERGELHLTLRTDKEKASQAADVLHHALGLHETLLTSAKRA